MGRGSSLSLLCFPPLYLQILFPFIYSLNHPVLVAPLRSHLIQAPRGPNAALQWELPREQDAHALGCRHMHGSMAFLDRTVKASFPLVDLLRRASLLVEAGAKISLLYLLC